MYYIAGLNVPLPSDQAVETVVTMTTFRFLYFCISRTLEVAPVAEAEAGKVRSMPTSFLSKVVSPVHGIVTFVPPVVYPLCVAANQFMQPSWMQRWSLPHDYVSQETKVALRVAACGATLALLKFFNHAVKHLGSQWHVIGRREKSRIVQTGPYAVVRHPLYTTVLIQQALFSVMFWSYVPAVGMGIVAAAFAVKMHIEEDLIMKDPAVSAEYRAYKQKVPARIIPFIW